MHENPGNPMACWTDEPIEFHLEHLDFVGVAHGHRYDDNLVLYQGDMLLEITHYNHSAGRYHARGMYNPEGNWHAEGLPINCCRWPNKVVKYFYECVVSHVPRVPLTRGDAKHAAALQDTASGSCNGSVGSCVGFRFCGDHN